MTSCSNSVFVNASTQQFWITLPSPSSTTCGCFNLFDATPGGGGGFQTNTLTLLPHGSETIGGLLPDAGTFFTTGNGGWTICSDGTQWWFHS
jgi:hypothetical protein